MSTTEMSHSQETVQSTEYSHWFQDQAVVCGVYIRSLYTHYKRTGTKVYLYESQVWQVMITYGGIILSFIKMVGAEQRPEERECVHALFVSVWARMYASVCVRVRA